MEMVYIPVEGNIENERYFSTIGKEYVRKLRQNATEKAEKWISSYLERYFLSQYFDDPNSLEEVRKEDAPVQFRNAVNPIYEVNLSPQVFNYWMLVIQYLNSLDHIIKWDVPTVIKNYENYVNSLNTKEDAQKILCCEGGYRWVQLRDKNSLDRESCLMQHCTARNDLPHLEQLLSNNYVFLSLRDKNNHPHITLKYNPRSKIIVDLVGKQNTAPVEKYYSYIICILNHLGLIPQNPRTQPYRHFMFQDGQWSLPQVESNG